MKQCKFCLAEIEEDAVRCPSCGQNLEEPNQEEPAQEEALCEETAVEAQNEEPRKKLSPGKIALAVVAVVVLVALVVALVLFGMESDTPEVPETTEPAATVAADGVKGTITEKGSYTASDDVVIANHDTVVATVGEEVLTNGQLQVYYWNEFYNFVNNYYYYLSYVGLDIQQGLDTQREESGLTWQQYFLSLALDSWHQYQAMAIAAEQAGYDVDEEGQAALDNLRPDLEAGAAQYDVTLEDYLRLNFGVGMNFEDYYHYMQTYYQGLPYYEAETAKMIPTDEQAEAYFAEHETEYAAKGITRDTKYVNVRHILITPETAEDGTISDEAWAAAKTAADELHDQWLAGEKTEESFAALANEHTDDPGSSTNGGLYENVQQGQMVKEFDAWCFDEARQTGDSDVVQTSYGYHIMYFVSANTQVWKDYAMSDWVSEHITTLMTGTVENNPMEISYDKIFLATVPEE